MSSSGAKRPREHDDVSELPRKRAITDLLICVSRQDCAAALSSCYGMFNHANQQAHDEDLASGSDAALCRLLSFLLLQDSFGGGRPPAAAAAASGAPAGRATRISDEIARACQVIEMAYRCTEQALEKSFQKVGPTFLQLFSNILEAALAQVQEYRKPNLRPMSGAAAPATELKLANACLQSVTKILSYYAKIKAAILLMARHRVLSLMIALLRPSGAVSLEARHNTLWTLANMACCDENMTRMADQPGLLDVVIQVANAPRERSDPRPVRPAALPLQHSAFRFLLNLSCEEQNKVQMSEREDLLDAIRNMAGTRLVPRSGSGPTRDVSARLLQTRLLALGTLRNVAHVPSPHKRRLCATRGGALLDVLCDATHRSEDPSICDKAIAVAFNLVSADTAEVLVAHPRLLDSLVDAASRPINFPEANAASDTSIMACRALNALDQATSRGSEECHARVRAAIDRVTRARQCHSIAPVPE